MANTVIQLKYSTANATPTSLNVGEPAYSFQSNKLFIGNSTNHVLTIGGKYYTDLVDAATDTNTASAIVKRDASGNFSAGTITAALSGNASTATKWQTARNIGVSGDATGIVSVDGSANANIPVTLTNTGVSAGVYGSGTVIPVINVAANGRVLSVTNVSVGISPSLSIAADTGTNVITVGTDTLTFIGGNGITSSIGPTDNVRFDVDNTVFRTTGGTIIGDVSVTGNLNVTGTTSYINVTNYQVEDTLIYLGANNYTSDILDIGFAANYDDGTGDKHVGIIRKAGTNDFYIFTGYNEELSGNNTFNIANPSIVYANTHANLKDGKLYNVTINDLAVDLAVKDGGTGRSSFTTGAILIGSGTGGLNELANTSSSGTYGDSTTIPVITVDAYGRVSSVTNTSISISGSSISNGSYYLSISNVNGTVSSNGAGFLLANGAIIKDTTDNALAFGENAGIITQGSQAVAIGDSAGYNNQGAYSVALGYGAGNVNQNQSAVAIGFNAALSGQGLYGVAIGGSAGSVNQGTGAIAIGYSSAAFSGNYSVAIGHESAKGNTSTIGANAIAIGYKAGYESAVSGSIILNASGGNLSAPAAGLYVDPVRYLATPGSTDAVMYYDTTTKEIRHSYSISGGTF